MTMLYVTVLVLLLICVGLSLMARSTWQWYHIFLACSVVMASFAFLVLASKTLRLTTKHSQDAGRAVQSLERETKRSQDLRYGTGREEDILESSLGVNAELGRSLMDRGRTWTNVTAVALNENKLVVDMAGWGNAGCSKVGLEDNGEPEPDPAADGAAAAPANGTTHNIEQDSILYLFTESPITALSDAERAILLGESPLPQADTEGLCKVPTQFLGEFKVSAVEGESITLEPIVELEPDQQAAVEAGSGTWAFYEMMPLDAHDAFVGLTAEQMQILIPQDATGLDADRYSRLIDSYVRDQQPANPGDPETNTMTWVRYLQNESIDVDVDDAESGVERAFDGLGRAQLAQLRLGSAAEFKSGDEVLFDTETAQRKIREGKVEAADKPAIYVRQLRDYAGEFQEKRYEIARLDDQIAQLKVQSAAVIAAAEKANEQIAYRTEEKEKLTEDLGNFRKELAVVKKYEADLNDVRKRQRAEISRLYRENRALALQLEYRTGQVSANPAR